MRPSSQVHFCDGDLPKVLVVGGREIVCVGCLVCTTIESGPVVTTDAAANETVVSRKRMLFCPSFPYRVHAVGCRLCGIARGLV